MFSGHPLLVALKAAQIIKVINKGPLCFAPDYTGVCLECVETTASCPGRDLSSLRIGIRMCPVWINPGQSVDTLEPISHPLVLCPISVRCHCPLSSLTLLYILLRFHSSNARSCFPNGEELTGLAEGHVPPLEGSCCVLLAVPVSPCS